MNNKLKSYAFFVKEKYNVFAAGETKAAEFGAVRANATKSGSAEYDYYGYAEDDYYIASAKMINAVDGRREIFTILQ